MSNLANARVACTESLEPDLLLWLLFPHVHIVLLGDIQQSLHQEIK